MKKTLALILILLFALTSLGCGKTSSTTGQTTGQAAAADFNIPLVMTLTGPNASYGVACQRGMQIAADEINAAGGIDGRQIKFIAYDDTGDPAKAASGASKFVDQKDVLILGACSLSATTLATIPILKDAGLCSMTVSSSAAKLTGISPFFFRMAANDKFIGKTMVDLAANRLKAKTAVVLYNNNDYGKGLNETLTAESKALGMNVLESIAFLTTDQDFTAIVTKVKALNPDVVYCAGTGTDSALLVKQSRQNGITCNMIGAGSVYNPKFIEIAGQYAEGMLLVTPFISSNPAPEIQAFVKKFQDNYKLDPESFAAMAYDEMYVIAEAYKAAAKETNNNVTRAAMQAALKKTNFKGITGTVTFNENNDWDRMYLTATVKDGKFVVYDK